MFMFFRIIACRRLRILTLSASVFYFLACYKNRFSKLANIRNSQNSISLII